MIIHGTPLFPDLLRDADAQDRFWYWRGISGRRYIHSVYPADACPPLPGAVYVLVKKTGTLRTALSSGLLSEWSGALSPDVASSGLELHVHLMAATPVEAQAIAADLAQALAWPGSPETSINEEASRQAA